MFEVKSFYSLLHAGNAQTFPWKGICRVKVPTKVAFFTWPAALGKILTMDNLQRRIIIVVEWYWMCKNWGVHRSLASPL